MYAILFFITLKINLTNPLINVKNNSIDFTNYPVSVTIDDRTDASINFPVAPEEKLNTHEENQKQLTIYVYLYLLVLYYMLFL